MQDQPAKTGCGLAEGPRQPVLLCAPYPSNPDSAAAAAAGTAAAAVAAAVLVYVPAVFTARDAVS
jgi:hypothetical protein